MGDQFLLRDGRVLRLAAETDDVEVIAQSFREFLEAANADPVEFLQLEPLLAFAESAGRALAPGELLSEWPLFSTKESENGVSLKAVPAVERIGFLAELAAQIRSLPDGGKFELDVS